MRRNQAIECIIILAGCLHISAEVCAGQMNQPHPSTPPSYRITIDLDISDCAYWGEATVRYVNTGDRSLRDIWFLLYPNVRASRESRRQPLLFIRQVAIAGHEVQFKVHRFTSVQINLPQPLGPGEAVEVRLSYFGRIPELEQDMTTLTNHVSEQISQVIGSKHRRVYWDPPLFVSQQSLVLSGFYPVLASRQGGNWQTSLHRVVDDVSQMDAADYQVTVRVPPDLSLYTSGDEVETVQSEGKRIIRFQGKALRNFLIVADHRFRVLSQMVGSVEVESIFPPQDEVVGREVLRIGVDALTAYQTWFGPYPYQHLRIVQAPLPASQMTVEAACLIAVARAYYIDLQSPDVVKLPDFIRQNTSAIRDAFEFNLAYAVARQWWGLSVEFDSERAHFMDNALATYAALLYYEETYGPEIAEAQREAQLSAAYRVYRTFGGEDKPVNQPIQRFTNNFQYAAIVHVKGALFFEALRRLIGDEAFSEALRNYFQAHRFDRTEAPQLLTELRRAAGSQSQQVQQMYKRWITWRRGDEDISPPEYQIIVSLNIKPSEEDRPSAFEWLGRFISHQMSRVGKYATKPFNR